jgi:hypothetical protein
MHFHSLPFIPFSPLFPLFPLRQQQLISLLALSTTELSQRNQQEMAENPVLEEIGSESNSLLFCCVCRQGGHFNRYRLGRARKHMFALFFAAITAIRASLPLRPHDLKCFI